MEFVGMIGIKQQSTDLPAKATLMKMSQRYCLICLVWLMLTVWVMISLLDGPINRALLPVKVLSPSQRQQLQKSIDAVNYQIPDDDVLSKLNITSLHDVYWRYVNSIQTICHNIHRVGSLYDGGKEVCIDDGYRPVQPCLVYSFGIDYRFDFDVSTEQMFGCEIHSFDPSMNKTDYRHSKKVMFHKLGLGERDYTSTRKWNMKTLGSIRKSLGHQDRELSILKIDIEGDEWRSLQQALQSHDLDDVKQILIEVHYGAWGGLKWLERTQLKILRDLYTLGFRICMRERNLYSTRVWKHTRRRITVVNELTLIRIS